MPTYQVCQTFFRSALAPFRKYRQNALLDVIAALTRGVLLTLTSIGRYLSGTAQIKHKIKQINRLLDNTELNSNIPMIFKNIT